MPTIRGVRPIRVVNSARGLVTPPVQRIHSMQPVDLNPRGATITVEVDGQNPFEGTGEIEIVTQASGGMSQADPSQSSRAVLSQEVAPITYAMLPGLGGNGDVVTGGVVAAGTVAPGTGVPLKTSSWSSLLEKVAGGYGASQTTAQAKAQAQIAQANSAAAVAEAQSRGVVAQYGANMAQHKGISGTFLAIGGAAIAFAVYLKMSGKNRPIGKKSKTTKRRR